MKSNEDQAVINANLAFQDTWRKRDAKAAASLFTDEGTLVEADGAIRHGRVEIEAAYDKLLNHTMPGAVLKQEHGHVRMLSPEFAVWQASFEVIPAEGAPSQQGHIVQVMQKVDGHWLALEAHPKLFPPPSDR